MFYFADAIDMDRSAPGIRTCDFPKANSGEQATGCFPIHFHCTVVQTPCQRVFPVGILSRGCFL